MSMYLPRTHRGGSDVIGTSVAQSVLVCWQGARLVFATKAGAVVPPRAAGSITMHKAELAHGVTAMGSGVRYSLFLLSAPPPSSQNPPSFVSLWHLARETWVNTSI